MGIIPSNVKPVMNTLKVRPLGVIACPVGFARLARFIDTAALTVIGLHAASDSRASADSIVASLFVASHLSIITG
jgi:hypothetical protein